MCKSLSKTIETGAFKELMDPVHPVPFSFPTWGPGSPASFKLKGDAGAFKSAIEATADVFKKARDIAEDSAKALEDAKELQQTIKEMEAKYEKGGSGI